MSTHRLLSSSFWGLQLLRSLWAYGSLISLGFRARRVASADCAITAQDHYSACCQAKGSGISVALESKLPFKAVYFPSK